MDCRVRKYAAAKPMTLKQRIHDDMKTAMRGGDKLRLMVIRMTMAAIKQREVDGRKDAGGDVDLNDQQVLEVVVSPVLYTRPDTHIQCRPLPVGTGIFILGRARPASTVTTERL